MFIPDPDFLPIPDPGSRIPDPKTSTKEGGEKKFLKPFFVATNFTKLKIILFLKCGRKQNLAQFSKKYGTFYPNIFPSPGVKKAPDPGSGSATLCAPYGTSLFIVVTKTIHDPTCNLYIIWN